MSNIIIYHNLACGTLRNTLEMVHNGGAELTAIFYLETLPPHDELVRLTVNTGTPVRVLLCKNAEPCEEPDLADDKFTDDRPIDLALQHPILINRPIVVTPLGTKFCRPSEVVLDVLPESQKGVLAKKDGEKVTSEAGKRLR